MGSNRFGAALIAAQFVLFGVLSYRMLAVEHELARLAESSPRHAEHGVSMTDSKPTLEESNGVADPHLRKLIREEIGAALVDFSAVASAATTSAAQMTPAAAESLPDFDYEREFQAVENSLDYYTQIGRITASEMAQLQSEIARLRPVDRTAVLRRLVRALNEGTLEGRL